MFCSVSISVLIHSVPVELVLYLFYYSGSHKMKGTASALLAVTRDHWMRYAIIVLVTFYNMSITCAIHKHLHKMFFTLSCSQQTFQILQSPSKSFTIAQSVIYTAYMYKNVQAMIIAYSKQIYLIVNVWCCIQDKAPDELHSFTASVHCSVSTSYILAFSTTKCSSVEAININSLSAWYGCTKHSINIKTAL